jgi:hypothetical protein
MSESIEKIYELSYAHSYFRTEMPIAVCPRCGIIDGVFQRDSSDGMGGGYGTVTFYHEHPLVFLILEEEDSHLAGPRSYYIDGEPPARQGRHSASYPPDPGATEPGLERGDMMETPQLGTGGTATARPGPATGKQGGGLPEEGSRVQKAGAIYLLNSLIVPADLSESRLIVMRRATVEEVKALLAKGNWESAVGHEATAKVLTQLLGIEVPTRRIAVTAKPGDVLVHLALRTRLPEGKVLTEAELQGLDFDLVVSEVHAHIACPSCQEPVYPPPGVVPI